MSEWYNDPEKRPEESGATSPYAENTDAESPVIPETPAVPKTPTAPEAPVVPQEPPMAPPPATPPAYRPVYQPSPMYRPQMPTTPPSPYGQPIPPAPQQTPPPKKKKGNAAVVILSVLCGVSLLICTVLGVMMVTGDSNQTDRDDSSPSASSPAGEGHEDEIINENGPTLEISDATDVDDGGLSTAEIVARNLDATVVLTMYDQSSSGYNYYGGMGTDGELVQAGEASGIIMSEDGYIITNSHCVYDEEYGEEYDRIDVGLYDGRVYEDAQIIGYDPTTDLAVIKIDETNLSVAEFGDSSALALGDRVITLGNSGGLQWSVSQGVLSGQARDVYEDTGYAIKCLQVDAVINPGSSGGPLLNAYGQVVGVNSAKIVLTGYEGLGFSIPINEAKEVIDDLVKYGYVTGRVALGITGRTITSVGYEGFMIESIEHGSALSDTNARQGDIITHVDGVRVMDYAQMRTELTSHEVGDTVTLTLIRLNQQTRQVSEFDITVVLQESR